MNIKKIVESLKKVNSWKEIEVEITEGGEKMYQKRFCPECQEYTEQRYYPSSRLLDSYFQCRKCGATYTMAELREIKQKEKMIVGKEER